MSVILLVLAAWAGISFIYMKVKHVSYITALKRVPLIIMKALLSNSSAQSSLRDKAKRAGREDIVQKIDEQNAQRKEMKSQVESWLDD